MFQLDINKLKSIKLDRAFAIKNTLRQWLQCKKDKHYNQKLRDILWLRNCVAHFDHIIGRSYQYYPPVKGKNEKNKWSYTNIHYQMQWVNKSLYQDGLLTHKSFAWYFELLFHVLNIVLKLKEQKDIANDHINKICKIIIKYEHFGFSDLFLEDVKKNNFPQI
ncbi:MAG: hypothetical protein ACRC4W_07175 [Treponemataceae bacterium]